MKKMRLVRCVSLIFNLVFLGNIPSLQAAMPSPVMLGEISWAGSSRSTSDEWIELWNQSDQPIQIGQWTLHGAADNGKTLTLPADAIIPPQGTFIISNYAANDLKSVLLSTPNVVTTTVSLSNSVFKIQLIDSNGVLVDEVGDSTTPPAGSSLPIKISMIRDRISGDWKNASVATNLIQGITDLATPGFCDDCQTSDPVQTEPPTDLPTEIPTEAPIEVPIEIPTETPSATTTAEVQEPPSSTTTENIPPPITDTPSTTETIPPPETPSNSTTTEETIPEVPENTSTGTTPQPTETPPVEENETTLNPVILNSSTTSISSPIIESNPPKLFSLLRLNEFMPDPQTGKEWIEIAFLDASNPISLKNCELRDATGTIFKFTELHSIAPTSTPYLYIELPSAKLNNAGDNLSLYGPDGQLIDTITYTESEKGSSWIRFPDMSGNWEMSLEPTPQQINERKLHEPETQTPTTIAASVSATTVPILSINTPAPTSIIKPINTPKTTSATTTTKTVKTQNTPIKALNLASSSTTQKGEKPKTTKAPTATKAKITTKKAAPKTATVKKTVPIILLTEDMLTNPPEQTFRVKVNGFVASPPELLTTHSFILMNAEGRGLKINLPKKFLLPKMGTFVTVIGKLEFDNGNVPHITVSATDSVTENKQASEVPKYRALDLMTYTNEDVWGLVHVSGTVLKIQGKRIHIDINGIETDIIIRPPVNYRAGRLLPGDIIDVIGILDPTGEDPRILPRTFDEIQLLKHVQPKLSATNSPTPQYPSWTPVGAAAGVVLMTEGAKSYKKRRDIKKLEAKLAEF